ncbi:cyanophycinase [Clostridium sartagoforme]|uniref:Cyanophycinase n=1 Tax=Clostridium sartagoforme TaxID=84031 RepID=A0A4S2DF39_9CLOT|nr:MULTISPECIES: cyanophycinase [Clostridium]MBS5939522.1 cyanophycinase [Clostridium sp.]TGY40609.1 cyanophycinase [Clostridium sartagoforme]
MSEKIKGDLIIIGGAEDKEGDKEILKKVCNSINKDRDLILIATIATEYPEEAFKKYTKIFEGLGVKNIKGLNIKERSDSEEEKNIDLIKDAGLIFFTGGDQLRITSLLGGTNIYDAIKEASLNGCTIVGTSAGASVMSDTMIVKGEDDESPRKCTLRMAPGLGLVEGIMIDQHFAQRGRVGRLLTGIAQNPEVVGVGIDEDTALVVRDNGDAQVVGNGAVYILDGRNITYSNVSEQNSDEVLSMFNVNLHVLKEGDKFNLLSKLPFEEEKSKDENSED